MKKVPQVDLAKRREWYASNKAAVAAHNREYYAANKERIKERCAANSVQISARNRKHYIANKSMLEARAKQWHAANKDAVVACARKYRAAHLDKVRQWHRAWHEAHPLKKREYRQSRRARIEGNGGAHTAEDIEALYEIQNKRCAGCSKLLRGNYDIDHVMPVSRGGSNSADNLQLLCGHCNRSKHDALPEQWAHRIGKLFV